jgi:hypothetical protein
MKRRVSGFLSQNLLRLIGSRFGSSPTTGAKPPSSRQVSRQTDMNRKLFSHLVSIFNPAAAESNSAKTQLSSVPSLQPCADQNSRICWSRRSPGDAGAGGRTKRLVMIVACVVLTAFAQQVRSSQLTNSSLNAPATPQPAVRVYPEKTGAGQTVATETVAVIHPEKSDAAAAQLPGQLSAYTDAPIYAQTSGQLFRVARTSPLRNLRERATARRTVGKNRDGGRSHSA